MCSISGAFALTSNIDPPTYRDVLAAAKERGRDSVGVAWDGVSIRAITNAGADRDAIDDALASISPTTYVIANNRATPTTEWVRDVSADDVQPYESSRFIVVHNGTIANDKELAAELMIDAPAIDSQIIADVLEDTAEQTTEGDDYLPYALRRLTGSFALAIFDKDDGSLALAANYKPIYTAVIDGALYFASQPHHLPALADVGDEFGSTVQKLEPYSWARFYQGGEIETGPLDDDTPDRRALVVLSGGLDSTVVLSKLIAEGYDVAALHISYGARADAEEIVAVNAICDKLGVELIHVTTDLFTNTIKASRLTNTHDDIAGGVAGAELAFEWVPARNLIMSSIAVGIAEARGFHFIALGNNLEESGAYPDNEQEFINRLNDVMPNAVNAGHSVRFIQPLGNLMKHEIVALGTDVDAPFALSWSCYNHGAKHCGNCGPCFMRHTAFLMNNLPDPTEYEMEPQP